MATRLVSGEADAFREFVAARLETRQVGRILEVHETIGSTNDRVKTLLESGVPSGLAVVALTQTAGRGRRGRVWESRRGSGLFVSFGVRLSPDHLLDVPFLVGLASAQGVERQTGISLGLKWPNDLVDADRRKVGGILVESMGATDPLALAVGIGIDVSTDRPSWLDGIASSLEELGANVALPALFCAIASALEESLDRFVAPGARTALHAAWTSRAVGLGERVRLSDGAEELDGDFLGLAPDGGLALRVGEATRTFYTGDVSLRFGTSRNS